MVKQYLLENFIMLFEIVGLFFIMRSSVHVSRRTLIYTYVALALLLFDSIIFTVERWLGNQEGALSPFRPLLSFFDYSLQPVIILLVMQITAPIKKKDLWLIIPVAANLILTFTSQWTHVVCYFSEDNTYHGGPLKYLPYFVFGFYLVVFFIQSIKHYSRYPVKDRINMAYIILASFAGMLLWNLFEYNSAYNSIFTSAIVLYFLFYYIETSKIDSLTGLMNRQCYYKEIKNTFNNKVTAVVSVDMNDLKYYNDSFGHAAGDKALKTVAKVLLMGTRFKKTVFRVGGDEFFILYYAASKEFVEKDIALMRAEMAKTEYVCAFGWSPVHSMSKIEDAVRYADALMYKEKATLKKTKANTDVWLNVEEVKE